MIRLLHSFVNIAVPLFPITILAMNRQHCALRQLIARESLGNMGLRSF